MNILTSLIERIKGVFKPVDITKTSNPMVVISKEFLKLYLILGFILRIVLMFCLPEGASLGVFDIIKAVVLGAVNDLAMGFLFCVPLALLYAGMVEWKYGKKAGYTILTVLVLLFIYVTFTHSIFHEYGGVVPKIMSLLVGYKLLSFALRLFLPKIRTAWRRITIYIVWSLYVYLLIGNTIAEWIFWDEFGVRYNFIAVDYLIYTNEVIGNIMESYAIVPMLMFVAVMTAVIIWLTARRYQFRFATITSARMMRNHLFACLFTTVFSLLYLTYVSHHLEGDNLAANQIQQNGCWDFVEAFQNNELPYDQFYTMLPEQECRDGYRQLTGIDTRQQTDTIASAWQPMFNIPEKNVNVVLITVESLSADFLTAFGNKKGITPCLDELSQKSMVFDNLYAVGNRTVRGLEALSLCIPPSAGESIVKRPDNRRNGMTVGHLLARHGYQVQYLYGGDSYFDNMGDYFGNNGYEVIDRKHISKVTFSNIWGVCDEDLYDKALQVFDANAAKGRPFFSQLMTVSNHRPYTFPEGRISFKGDPKCRDGAVKYTDYAIGHFLKQAESHTWFDNTIFIIVADHCASSAGKTSIPVNKYHIPCIVYAPKMIQPCHVETLCSQIDLIPTLLAMLHVDDKTTFTGRNVLADNYASRVFMATYQDLGYMENDILTVLSPKKDPQQYAVTMKDGHRVTGDKLNTPVDSLIRKARIYYQYANLYHAKDRP